MSERRLFAAGEALKKVTADEVQQAAGNYLRETNRIVATLIPEKETEAE